MKKNLLTCCIIFLSIISKAQPDTIPNAGFENWWLPPNWTIQATDWQSNNSSIAAWNVIPDSFPHSGMLALQLVNYSYRGTIWTGFPLTNHPSSFDGFMKNGLGIGDTAFIRIHVYSANVIVDSGYAEIYGGIGTIFFPFSIPVSQNSTSADSCVITLEGGNSFGGSISFDDLFLSFPVSVDEQNENTGWNIFPNPCSDALFVNSPDGIAVNSILTLSDAAGRLIEEKRIPIIQKQYVMDMQSLSAGVYFLCITNGEKRSNHIIIKN